MNPALAPASHPALRPSETPPLSYDYQWEEEVAQRRAMAEWREREAVRNSPETLTAAMTDAATRLLRQAVREPRCPSAYDRAHRRWVKACDAYQAHIEQRREA